MSFSGEGVINSPRFAWVDGGSTFQFIISRIQILGYSSCSELNLGPSMSIKFSSLALANTPLTKRFGDSGESKEIS